MFINYLTTIEINGGEDILHAGYEFSTGMIYYSKNKNGPWILCEDLGRVFEEETASKIAYYYALGFHGMILKQLYDHEHNRAS